MGIESKIPGIIVIIIAAIFLVFLLVKGGYVSEGTQKYIDNIINAYFGGSTNNVTDVSGEFQNIVSQYKNCFDSSDDGCICNIHILTFSPRYVLSFSNPNNIGISNPEVNIPKNNVLLTGKNIFCYVTYENGEVKVIDISTGIKDLFEKNVYIPLSTSPLQLNYIRLSSSISSEAKKAISGSTQEIEVVTLNFLSPNQIAYKQGDNICFILRDELSDEGKAFINTLNQCSPKPLNS